MARKCWRANTKAGKLQSEQITTRREEALGEAGASGAPEPRWSIAAEGRGAKKISKT